MNRMSLRPLLNYTVGKYIYFRHQWRSSFPITCLIFGAKVERMSLRRSLFLRFYRRSVSTFISNTNYGRLSLSRVSFLVAKWNGYLSAGSLTIPSEITFISGINDGRVSLLPVSFLAPIKWSGCLSSRSLFLPSVSTLTYFKHQWRSTFP